MAYTFVIADEHVIDSDGERVMIEGIDLTRFEKNPVCLFMHDRWDCSNGIVIGKWMNFRKENGQLLGDVEFDEKDDFARKIEDKVDGGFLNGCSPHYRPLVLSDNPEDKLEGQIGYTYLKSSVMEISIVDIPANENALRVKTLERIPALKSLVKNYSMDPPSPQPPTQKQNSDTMKEILKALGLDEKASGAEALVKVNALKAEKEKADKLIADIDAARADKLVALGVAKGLIDDTDEAKKAAKEWFGKDLDAAERFIGNEKQGEEKPKASLPDSLKKFLTDIEKKGTASGTSKKYSELSDEEIDKMDDDELREMMKKEGFLKDQNQLKD